MKNLVFIGASFLILQIGLIGQNVYDGRKAVIIEATIQEDPPQIQLTWVADTENLGYTIYRKFKAEASWGDTLAMLGSTSTGWTDSTIHVGIGYEYRVVKDMPHFPQYEGPIKGFGYIYAGIKIAPLHFRGNCLIVIDSSIAPDIQEEIDRLVEDVRADGWNVETLLVDRNDSVTVVKAGIRNWAVKDTGHQKSLLLLGHVPVPYSGNIAPDGHTPDHLGAWPADGYYANLDGIWTDASVNITAPPGTRNDNVPGDGKFDNRFFSTSVMLQVGRIDLSGMTKFPESEEELLRRYLDKDHAWRTGRWQVIERGLIDNNFPQDGEGIGQTGWKNFAPMFGIQKVYDLPYRSTLMNDSYLWSFGAGGGGPESASDISNTTNFVTDSLQTIFTFLFGSYFGDWDATNNFLRAPLASRSTLTCTWGTRPNWQVHHMALGEHIGYSTQLTMNNVTLYDGGNSVKFVHIALMGDPTLRMHILQPIQDLAIHQEELHVRLEWQDSSNALGYYVYKKSAGDSAFSLLNSVPVTGHSFLDSCAGEGLIRYMVRSVELRTSGSGSYYNLSSGVSDTILANPSAFQGNADFSLSTYFDQLSFENNSTNAISYVWDFGDGQTDTTASPSHLFLQSGDYTVCLTSADACFSSIHCQDVSVLSSLPSVMTSIEDVKCYGDSTGSIALLLNGGTPIQVIQWVNLPDTVLMLTQVPVGSYYCNITSATGNSMIYGPFVVDQPMPWDLQSMTTAATPGESNGTATVDPVGGCDPYTFLWDDFSTTASIQNLAAGTYCVTITDCEGCMEATCLNVALSTSLSTIPDVVNAKLYPSPATDWLTLDLQFTAPRHVKLQLENLQGAILAEDVFSGELIHHQWNIDGLPGGVYLLRIECDGRVSSMLWMKE